MYIDNQQVTDNKKWPKMAISFVNSSVKVS